MKRHFCVQRTSNAFGRTSDIPEECWHTVSYHTKLSAALKREDKIQVSDHSGWWGHKRIEPISDKAKILFDAMSDTYRITLSDVSKNIPNILSLSEEEIHEKIACLEKAYIKRHRAWQQSLDDYRDSSWSDI